MKIAMYAGFSDIIRKKGAKEAVEYATERGFSYVELLEVIGHSPVINNVEEAKALASLLEAKGIKVSCFSVAVNLWKEGMLPEDVTEAEKTLLNYVDIAKNLGSPYFHHTLTLGVRRDMLSIEDALSLIVPVAARIARYAYERGVVCLYEDQGAHFNDIENFGRFYRAVKEQCPYVGVCGDFGNMIFTDEDPVAFFKVFAAEMKHVHVKDYHIAKEVTDASGWARSIKGNYLKESVIGEGNIDLKGCFDALKKVGYDGVISLENCHGGDLEYGIERGRDAVKHYFYGI